MDIFIRISQFLVSISLLIIIHEFGHFIFARIFKTRVEKFYLFFNPWFSLFKVKKGETEYGIGWLPLGGYVKIAGMIDESMDKEQMKKPPQPYEFRTKKAWQRLLIMLGGVMFNVIGAFLIFIFMLNIWGEKYLPIENAKYGIWVTDSVMYDNGFRNGDKILSVNGEQIKKFSDINKEIIHGGKVTIERNGKKENIELPVDFAERLIEQFKNSKDVQLIYPRIPFIIDSIPSDSKNVKSGLKKYDKIVAVNGYPVEFYDQATTVLDTLKGKQINLTVLRNGKEKDVDVKISKDGKIGVFALFFPSDLEKAGIFKYSKINYNFFQAIPAGLVLGAENIKDYLRQIKLIFNFKTGAYKGVGGFKAITQAFAPVWNWHAFWSLTALLSIMLAVINLLPIPALDGGHVIFTLYEMITGRKPGDKFLEYAQIIGLILVLLLVIYANGNDFGLFGK